MADTETKTPTGTAASNLKAIHELVVKKSLLHGEFTLASGQKSNYYIDGKRTTLDPEGAYLLGREIFNMIKDLDVAAVGGPSIGADPIATAVAIASYELGKPIPAFIVREGKKEHGTMQQVFGRVPGKGDRVVIVEDVVTTGGSILKAMEAVEATGAKIVKVIALLDRHQGGSRYLKEHGYDFTALLHASPKGEITLEPPP
ncbi:MAG: orotate phosphoribosyltransferase [Chloroflexi bacterium]|nr:orotate phosphoribosyltransferase [Chloroflexota bacterium]